MGKVYGNWVTGLHSGRACKHDDIYTKVFLILLTVCQTAHHGQAGSLEVDFSQSLH